MLAVVVSHGIALLVQHQQAAQELGVVGAAQRIGAVAMQLGRLVLVGESLVSLEGIEADDAAIEVQRLENGAQVLAQHRGLPAPGPDVENRARDIHDQLVEVRDREDPGEQRAAQEKSERALFLLVAGLVCVHQAEDLHPCIDALFGGITHHRGFMSLAHIFP